MWAIHVGSLLLVFVTCILLFCLGYSFFSPLVGGVAALLYALASTTYYTPRMIAMNTETLMVVFTLEQFPRFRQLVEERYELEHEIHEVRLYRLRDAVTDTDAARHHKKMKTKRKSPIFRGVSYRLLGHGAVPGGSILFR